MYNLVKKIFNSSIAFEIIDLKLFNLLVASIAGFFTFTFSIFYYTLKIKM